MDISIPDGVVFTITLKREKPKVVGETTYIRELCFTHAVQAAMRGHKVKATITHDSWDRCVLCSEYDYMQREDAAWIKDTIRQPPASVVE